MEDFLKDVCSSEDLKKFEKKYNTELASGNVASSTQFEYACFLVRSKYPADIQRGVVLLEELYKKPEETGKRDYIYYLAIGNARLKEFKVSLNYLRGLLRVEPGNRQVIELEAAVKKEMEKEALKGAAVAGGAILLGGVLVGLGMVLSKK